MQADFINKIPALRMQEPFAKFLGASPDGIFTYSYADAVKLAGHSCGTVAGAYLMVVKGLSALYGEELPVRGDIEVFMRDGCEQGATGVVAAIVGFLTGATTETGFPGLGPDLLFKRKNLLVFDAAIDSQMALRRRDTGAAVTIDIETQMIPIQPQMDEVKLKVFDGTASSAEIALFQEIWQGYVYAILVEYANDPNLVRVSPWHQGSSASPLDSSQSALT